MGKVERMFSNCFKKSRYPNEAKATAYAKKAEKERGDPTVYTFGNRPGRAGVLKGTGEVIALNFNAQTLTGFNCDATVEWTEE